MVRTGSVTKAKTAAKPTRKATPAKQKRVAKPKAKPAKQKRAATAKAKPPKAKPAKQKPAKQKPAKKPAKQKPAKQKPAKQKPAKEIASPGVVGKGATVGLAFQMFKVESDGREVPFAEFTADDPTERTIAERVEDGDMWDRLKVLEQQLHGLAPGATFDIRIEANDAYGPRRDDKVFVLTGDLMKEFLSGVGVGPNDWNCLAVGEWHDGDEMEIDGRSVEGKVVELSAEKIVLDRNHALAGYPLHVVGTVVFVR